MKLRAVCGLLIVAALSACDIGDGSKLESLAIISPATGRAITAAAPHETFLCFRDRLALVGTFTDGSAGGFSGRATWTSSDPSKVKVLNFQEQQTRSVVAGAFAASGNSLLTYTPGVLVPQLGAVAGDRVTITASFLGLRAEATVVVRTPSLELVRSPIVTNGAETTPLPVAEGFRQPFAVRVRRQGQVTDIRSFEFDVDPFVGRLNSVLWRFTSPNNVFSPGDTTDTITTNNEPLQLFPAGAVRETDSAATTATATLAPTTGVFSGITATAAPRIEAVFDTDTSQGGVACPVSSVALDVEVKNVTSLTLNREPGITGATPSNDLVIGTDEFLQTLANLAGGGTQDVSTQVGYEVIAADRDVCTTTPATATPPSVTTCGVSSSILRIIDNRILPESRTGSFCDDAGTPGISGNPRFECQSTDPTVDTVKVRACAPSCLIPSAITMASNNLEIRTIPATLTAFGAVQPSGPITETALTFPGQPYRVFGTFAASSSNKFGATDAAPATGASTADQSLTRYMAWFARPVGSITERSTVARFTGLYQAVQGQTYYLRNPATAETVDVTALPITDSQITGIAALSGAGTLTAPAISTLTVAPCITADTTGVCP